MPRGAGVTPGHAIRHPSLCCDGTDAPSAQWRRDLPAYATCGLAPPERDRTFFRLWSRTKQGRFPSATRSALGWSCFPPICYYLRFPSLMTRRPSATARATSLPATCSKSPTRATVLNLRGIQVFPRSCIPYSRSTGRTQRRGCRRLTWRPGLVRAPSPSRSAQTSPPVATIADGSARLPGWPQNRPLRAAIQPPPLHRSKS
jgi:hypothetical protein